MLGVKKKKNKDEKLTFFKGSWIEEELIGSGSYGKVYKAKKDEFGAVSYCAIKRIEIPQSEAEIYTLRTEGMTKEDITNYFEDSAKRWVEEIKFMATFKDSQNIVHIEDYEVIEKEKNTGYIIHIRMELLENLNDYAMNNKITDKEILKMAIDVCEALEDCEKNQVIHRDIKPENIFVNKKGVFKVGDFGIAKKVQGTLSNLSKKGTENYMAPELYKNQKGSSTVDTYSLGIMLYRYFNYNRLPFLPDYPENIKESHREEALYKRISGEKMPPPKNATRDLAEIILKACNYYSKNRYLSATDLKSELEIIYNSIKKPSILFDYNNHKMEKILKENSKSLESNGTISFFGNKKDTLLKEDTAEQPAESINEKVDIEEPVLEEPKEEKVKLKKKEKSKKEELTSEPNEKIEATPAFEVTYKEDLTSTETKIKNSFFVKIKSKMKIIIAIVVVLFVLFGGGFSYAIIKWADFMSKEDTSKLTIMPNVLNILSQDALNTLKDSGLEVDYEYVEVEDESQVGLVLEQSHEAFIELTEGTLITLKVGVSKEKITLPSVVEKTEEEATKTFEDLGLQVNVTEQYSDNVKKGQIISQMPEAGTEVYKNSVVEILVSLGKKETSNSSSTSTSKKWSDWVATLPSNVTEKKYTIDTRTEYRYQDKETTTSDKNALEGWTKYDEKVEYSAWSSNKTTYNTTTESDTVKIVSTKKEWYYYHYVNWYDNQWNVDSIAYGSNQMRCSHVGNHELPRLYGYADKGNKPMYRTEWACGSCNFHAWFLETTKTKYTYQTRTKTVTYHFYKWNSWSDWQTEKIASSDSRQVETRTLYRYKEK